MIEGMKFDFSGEELREQLLKRCAHHKKRAAFYKEQHDAFVREAEDAEIKHGQNTYVQTKKSMADQMQIHEKAVPFFQILADHVVEKETFRLDVKDMNELEFFGQNNYGRFY